MLLKVIQVGNTKDTGFLWLEEITQLERLLAFMSDDSIGELDMNRSDFWKYVDEYDKRRNTDFEKHPRARNVLQNL